MHPVDVGTDRIELILRPLKPRTQLDLGRVGDDQRCVPGRLYILQIFERLILEEHLIVELGRHIDAMEVRRKEELEEVWRQECCVEKAQLDVLAKEVGLEGL